MSMHVADEVVAQFDLKSPAQAKRAARAALVQAYRNQGKTLATIRVLLRRKHGIHAGMGTIFRDLKGAE